jgi:hypothetical protein
MITDYTDFRGYLTAGYANIAEKRYKRIQERQRNHRLRRILGGLTQISGKLL